MFQTFTKSIKRKKNLWEIQVKNGGLINSKNLVLSSSLIAHPRCLGILGINSLPLRDALIPGQDKLIDSVLHQTKDIMYIKRKIYILHVSNFSVVRDFNKKYLQIVFSKVINDNFNFEKIIFQKQSDGSIVVALHCAYLNNFLNKNIDDIIKLLKYLFRNYPSFIDLILEARLIDTMDWRASQPLNHFLSKELQWSSSSKIGFCGDWFNWQNCGGVESAMNSSIRLAKLVN